MRIFSCPVCQNRIYFDNTSCNVCGTALGYESGANAFVALGDGLRLCANHGESGCNWLARAEAASPFCLACDLNEIIPPIADPAQRRRWAEVEAAKRKLIYSFLRLGVPIYPKRGDASGLSFRILVAAEHGGAGQVTMGHENGVITIDATEADAPMREFRRAELDERYRTLIGHMRHESGHYFWERLGTVDGFLPAYRALFDDERADYGQALQRHYETGPPADWADNFISAYATAHPWEDWAESFAHYLHMIDGVETAASFGVSGRAVAAGIDPAPAATTARPASGDGSGDAGFRQTLADWHGIAILMNAMNRSLGHQDFYPFVVSPAVADKLVFIDVWMRRLGGKSGDETGPSAS